MILNINKSLIMGTVGFEPTTNNYHLSRFMLLGSGALRSKVIKPLNATTITIPSFDLNKKFYIRIIWQNIFL